MMQGRLPDAIYRPLPYFYACAGALALILANNIVAVLSGALLITAGALVWYVRYQYRKQMSEVKFRASSQRGPSGPSAGALMEIRWRKSFETGHAILDDQHRELFSLGEELINSVLNNSPEPEVRALLDDILAHIEEHFNTEETILSAMRHPVSKSHESIHRDLLAMADQISSMYKEGKMPSKELVNFVIFDLINDHLMNEDTKFFDKLKAKVSKRK